MASTQQTISNIIIHRDFITFEFESGLNSNTTNMRNTDKFEVGEVITLQSNGIGNSSQYFKLK